VAGKEQWLEKNSGWERAVAGEELWLETSYGWRRAMGSMTRKKLL
jgi:hypothetical protein